MIIYFPISGEYCQYAYPKNFFSGACNVETAIHLTRRVRNSCRLSSYFLKVPVANIPPDAAAHITCDMSAVTEPLPTGTATLK